MKGLVAKDALRTCPDHDFSFDIYKGGSDLQLGAVMVLTGRLVTFYSIRLNSAPRSYTTKKIITLNRHDSQIVPNDALRSKNKKA